MNPIKIGSAPALFIALEDGETSETRDGGPTDEGTHHTWTVYRREGDTITSTFAETWRDCDGPGSRSASFTWTVDSPLTGQGFPDWTPVEEERRDRFAEAAGY